MTRRRFFPWTRPGYRLLDNFARASALRERHGRFGAASSRDEPNRLDEIRYLMKLAERDAIEAGAPRPTYGFAAHDVADILTDASARVFFRLHDGRVFSDQGEPEGRDLTDLHGLD
jgi:hypothetical protein